MLFEYIEKLRQKPHHEKTRITFLSAVAITLVIFFVWITILGLKDTEDKPDVVSEVKRMNSPIQSIKSLFSGFLESLPDDVFNVKTDDTENATSTGF